MRVFISHEKKDTGFADKLVTALETIDINPLRVNLREYLGPDVFNLQKLNRAMPDCSQAIAILSPAYVNSDWLPTELSAFSMKEGNTKSEVIIPIVIKNCRIPAQLKNRKFVDFRNTDFETAFNQLRDRISKDRHIFVVMDYGDEMKTTYKTVVETIKSAGFEPVGKDNLLRGGRIDEQILTEIARSEVVLADLTCEPPNCYYETGYAHALGKELILTIRRGSRLHFDLAAYPAIEWETPEDLKTELNKRLDRISKGSA